MRLLFLRVNFFLSFLIGENVCVCVCVRESKWAQCQLAAFGTVALFG